MRKQIQTINEAPKDMVLFDSKGTRVGEGDTLLVSEPSQSDYEIKIKRITNQFVTYSYEGGTSVQVILRQFTEKLKQSVLLKAKGIVLKDKDGKVVKVGDILFMEKFNYGNGEHIQVTALDAKHASYIFLDRDEVMNKGYSPISLFKENLKSAYHKGANNKKSKDEQDDFEDKTSGKW